GNSSTASRTITWTFDVTPPVITATGTTVNNANLGCNPTVGAIDSALDTASATDNCGSATATPVTSGVTSSGCSRSQSRTWTATDACGNSATVTRTINWTADITPPIVTCPGNITRGLCNNVVTFTGSATDNCGPVTPPFTPPSG